MGRFQRLLAAASALLTAPAVAHGQPAAPAVEGEWVGTLGPAELHLAVHVRRAATGLTGTMDSLDQGSMAMPLAAVEAAGGRFVFDVPAVGGHFAGAWDAASRAYRGEWTQQNLHLPLALTQGAAATRPAIAGLDGDWDGVLQLGVMGSLRLVFHVRSGPGGTVASLESPDQGTGQLPFSTFTREGTKVRAEAKAIGARFEGVLDPAGTTLDGRWTQGGQEKPLVLKRRTSGSSAPAALRRPQTPVPPFPYRQIEVAFDNAAGHNRLAGTLTVPEGRGPFPAALLITGSGLQDRDETLMGHKPFLVLADYLSRRGIAVLRVDDRSIGGSTGDPKGTTFDLATDTEAGLTFLLTRAEIDRRRIGLVGHSEGGAIAPLVAARNPAAAWIVLLAGPGVPGDRVILAQQRLIQAAGGVPQSTIDANSALQRRLLDVVERAPTQEAALAGAKKLLLETGMREGAAEGNAAAVSSNWYRTFLKLDPAPALRAVHVPVLALIGSLDLQVPAADNIPKLKAALAGNGDATVVELPGLNHLFQTARTGAIAEYAQIEETIAPVALRTVGDWIASHSK